MIIRIKTKQDALESLAKELYPSYQFVGTEGMIIIDTSIDDGIIDGKYTSNTTCPFTEAEIQAELTRLQAEYDSQEYARLRKAAYDLLNQDEMRYDDAVNGTTTWQDAILAIKAEFPKPV